MSIKILLADDSITIQKVVGIIFGGEDYSLTVVDNGKTAVEKAGEINPDVLLIDALMPGMSGYEVCEAVRSNPALSTKPILLLTGSFEPFDENKAKACGADDFIAKPFESQQIVSKVKELFELGQQRASAPTIAPTIAPEIIAPPVIETNVVTTPVFAESETKFEEAQPAAFTPEISPFETTSLSPEPPMTATQTATPAIWDAFTPAEPTPVIANRTEEVGLAMPSDDVFAMVQEEPEAVAPQQATAVEATPHQHVDSQWIPVEEQSFEFQEEEVAEIPPAVFDEPPPLSEKTEFDESPFEAVNTPAFEPTSPFGELSAVALDAPAAISAATTEIGISPFETSYQESPSPKGVEEATAIAQPTAAVETAAPQTLSEEQLKVALASVSKDVIERIVWEVVPDLAEAMIKEAIRKIKEGL